MRVGGASSAASVAAGVGVAASCARFTAIADMDTVDTTAVATIASIITLSTWSCSAAPASCTGLQCAALLYTLSRQLPGSSARRNFLRSAQFALMNDDITPTPPVS